MFTQLKVRITYATFTHRLVLLETGRAKYWGVLACIPSDGVGHHCHHCHCLLYHYCQISFLTIIIIVICRHYSTLSPLSLSDRVWSIGHHYLKGLIVIQCWLDCHHCHYHYRQMGLLLTIIIIQSMIRLLPTTLSLACSFISAITILGTPAGQRHHDHDHDHDHHHPAS